MKTLLEVLQLSTQYLLAQGIAEPKREAEQLIADFFQLSRMQLYLQFDRPLEENELSLLRERLLRRSKNEPLAYIQGEVEFYGLKLLINPSVLIPRQETEILVDTFVKHLKGQDLRHKKLLDLCTGSGCIGLSVKKALPDLTVALSDISEKALAVAKQNAINNKIDVEIVQGDLLAPFKEQEFVYLISNPPYISEKEFLTLDSDVKDYEPKEALVSGKTGLEFYQRIQTKLPHILKKGGEAWFEIGATQGEALKEIFKSWNVKILPDYSNHDRFLIIS